MRYTIERLIQGDTRILQFWKAAVDLWGDLVTRNAGAPLADFARDVGSAQRWFEQHCGGRSLGQQIMAWVAVAQFYQTSVGFEGEQDNVLRVIRAVRASHCSSEVQEALTEAVTSYGLSEAS